MADGFRGVVLAVMVSAVVGVMAPANGLAGPLDPLKFDSLDALSLSRPGTYAINSAGPVPTLVVGGSTYRGVVSNGVAVFDFSSVTIASGVTLTASAGGLPIALLSRSTEVIMGRVDVSASGFTPGPGEQPGGSGGPAASGIIQGGQGPPGLSLDSGAGGGGFGGAGGRGGSFDFSFPTPFALDGGAGGGTTSGLAAQLLGGSPGGGSMFGTGGRGGGAIELGAVQVITIDGEVDANGGDALGPGAGGGSGGGIFLHADSVTVSGILDVRGGSGGAGLSTDEYSGEGGGGGGGGGVIDILSGPGGYSDPGALFDLGGGLGGGYDGGPGFGVDGLDGSSGVLVVSVPEPSSLVLLGTSMMGLLGASAWWHRHQED